MTRHRFDTFSFLAGAIAVTVGGLVLLDAVSLRLVDLRVTAPLLVLALGLALLVGGGRDEPADTDTADPDTADPDGDDTDGEADLEQAAEGPDHDPGTNR